jgi:hypothetical protein
VVLDAASTKEDHMLRTKKIICLLGLSLLASACSEPVVVGAGPDSMGHETTPDEAFPQDKGVVRLYLVDAPAAFEEAWVTIRRVEVSTGDEEGEESWLVLADEPGPFDLLTLQDGVSALLGETALTPGAYGQLRLIIDDAYVVSGGEILPLRIPSAAQTGIKIDLNVEIEAGTAYSVVLDFDALESIRQHGNGPLMMSPVVHVQSVDATPMMVPEVDGGAAEVDGGLAE